MKRAPILTLIVLAAGLTFLLIPGCKKSEPAATPAPAKQTEPKKDAAPKPADQAPADVKKDAPAEPKPADAKTPESAPAEPGKGDPNKPARTAEGKVLPPGATPGTPAEMTAERAAMMRMRMGPDGKPIPMPTRMGRGEPNQPGAAPGGPGAPGEKKAEAPKGPPDPNELVEILLNDTEMKQVISKIVEMTGKVVIAANDEIMSKKITIYSTQKIPRRQALALIYRALQSKGFMVEDDGAVLMLKTLKEAKQADIPMVLADQALASVEDKSQIVQKFFRLKNYSPSRLLQIIQPLINTDYGSIAAEEGTRQLIIMEKVANLMRIERYINQLDLPETRPTDQHIFAIKNGDPAEIVQLLQLLLGDGSRRGGPSSSSGPSPESYRPEGMMRGGPEGMMRGGPGGGSGSSGGGPLTAVIVGQSTTPIVLIPEMTRKWIIARAGVEDMLKIGEWITKLDLAKPDEGQYELIQVNYTDVRELAGSISQMIREMPGNVMERATVIVKPLEQSRQIMVVGNAEKRAMVRKIVEASDVIISNQETREFKLKYADPDTIKKNVDDLYDLNKGIPSYAYYYRRQSNDPSAVRTISFPMLKQITVIASPENMKKIIEQIKEWDSPIEVDKLKPLIVELKNSDPLKMEQLLTAIFSQKQSNNDDFFRRFFYYGDDTSQTTQKVVGPLYGQLSFKAVPENKKIIVMSNLPEGYEVVKRLIEELDKANAAELPMVFQLKYADCEDLCDQLNAILNTAGTTATILRSKRGLSAYEIDAQTGQKKETPGQGQGQFNPGQSSGRDNMAILTPWWDQSQGMDSRNPTMPTSNLIGKIRFIPVYRSKSLLVLAPPEYHEGIQEMIENLDKPGQQVMVKAILLEVNHQSLTNLGVKYATDPTAFGPLEENALSSLSALKYQDNSGAFTATSSLNVNVLVDLLVRKANARVLNQPTLWTKDNEEAEFFKGRSVPFLKGTFTTDVGAQNNQIEYRPVGLTLRVRPNITPQRNVDMTVNITASQVEPQNINGNVVTSMLNTKTNSIVADGATIMIGGIIFQGDQSIKQKVPILGDIPIIGGLFSHVRTQKDNNELLVFITPYVINENPLPETTEQIEKPLDKMNEELLELMKAAETAGK